MILFDRNCQQCALFYFSCILKPLLKRTKGSKFLNLSQQDGNRDDLPQWQQRPRDFTPVFNFEALCSLYLRQQGA